MASSSGSEELGSSDHSAKMFSSSEQQEHAKGLAHGYSWPELADNLW